MPSNKSGEHMKIEISRILNSIGAFQFGAFRLTSGKMSPYYIDLRVIPSFPDAFRKICNFYTDFIIDNLEAKNFARVAGIPVAGIPFASLIAYKLEKPFLYIRKGARRHGRERRIEGVIAPGERILLVDDLITTGLSLQNAAKTIVAEGGLVTDAAVLLDRQEGGRKKLSESGIRVHALVNVTEVANTLYDLGTINEEQLKTILKQIRTDRKA